jgi:vancomycin resistance protein VanW
MARKYITQIFPWLLPVRKKQRLFCFYAKLDLDGNRYASKQSEILLPHRLFETGSALYNPDTGFDMEYQENKVFNLKLAAAKLDKLVIAPKETFSFWKAIRYADRHTPYKDGLTVIDGVLTTSPGGGMCQMSNLLFWLFLHTPLTIVERHGHDMKDFPDPKSDAPAGVDATVSQGWLDLKVRNDTDASFQISVDFDAEHIIGRIYTDTDTGRTYRVENGQPLYYRRNGSVFEEVDVNQSVLSRKSGECLSSKTLYRNKCKIGYQLPAGTPIQEKG